VSAADPARNTITQPGTVPQPRPGRTAVGDHTLKIEAARAGVTVQEYLGRLSQGLLYCYRCEDWHEAGAFDVDPRRHTGRAGSCRQSIRAVSAQALAHRGQLPPPPAVWVIRRPQPSSDPRGSQAWAYWHKPRHRGRAGPDRTGTWSPDLDDDVARFPAADQARDALIAAFGGAAAVPPGCRLVRLA
jgi:hypothetical protein